MWQLQHNTHSQKVACQGGHLFGMVKENAGFTNQQPFPKSRAPTFTTCQQKTKGESNSIQYLQEFQLTAPCLCFGAARCSSYIFNSFNTFSSNISSKFNRHARHMISFIFYADSKKSKSMLKAS